MVSGSCDDGDQDIQLFVFTGLHKICKYSHWDICSLRAAGSLGEGPVGIFRVHGTR